MPQSALWLRRSLFGASLSLAGLFTLAVPNLAPRAAPNQNPDTSIADGRGYEGPGGPDRESHVTGGWRMFLPAGYQHEITLTPTGPNQYRLAPARLDSSGIYELRGSRLVMAAPTDPRLLGFEWEMRGEEHFVLVAQPPLAKIGSNYLGAVLRR
jgi:hypothetical protein